MRIGYERGGVSLLYLSLKGNDMSVKRLKEIESSAMVGRNHLQRALQSAAGAKGFHRTGARLSGGRHLINTYNSVQRGGSENMDRYKRSYVEPEVRANISLVIDASGSMNDEIKHVGRSLMKECMMATHALGSLTKRLKVGYSGGLVIMGNHDDQMSGVTGYCGNYLPLWECGKATRPLQDHLRYRPTDGTHIATYARTSLEVAMTMPPADHSLAVYMTDGECGSIEYLESITRMAQARGVHLVGVVMGGASGRGHPCAIECRDGGDFARQVGEHLAKVVSGRIKPTFG